MSAPSGTPLARMWSDDPRQSFDFSQVDPGMEVEEIMKRKVTTSTTVSPLARNLHESRLMGATSPLAAGDIPSKLRNSPSVRTQSPSYRHSPKLEQELLELGNLPPPQYQTPPSTLTRGSTAYPPARGSYPPHHK